MVFFDHVFEKETERIEREYVSLERTRDEARGDIEGLFIKESFYLNGF